MLRQVAAAVAVAAIKTLCALHLHYVIRLRFSLTTRFIRYLPPPLSFAFISCASQIIEGISRKAVIMRNTVLTSPPFGFHPASGCALTVSTYVSMYVWIIFFLRCDSL